MKKEKIRLDQEIKNATHLQSEIERKQKDAEEKKEDISDQVNREKMSMFDREKEFNEQSKKYELEKEKEVVLLSDKYKTI